MCNRLTDDVAERRSKRETEGAWGESKGKTKTERKRESAGKLFPRMGAAEQSLKPDLSD